MLRLDVPSHIDFNVTSTCNMSCRHCHYADVARGRRLQDDLSTGSVKDIIKQISDLGVSRLVFSGGEPFFRSDISELLSYAASLPGIYVSAVTNATLLNDRLLTSLKPIRENITLNCSLDGSTPAAYMSLRG